MTSVTKEHGTRTMGNIVALIPARGGSKGIPRKNLMPFNGRPLVSYVITEALKCAKIHRVIVSTDDEEIAGVARDYGAEVPFLRPKEISGDHASSLPAFQHAIHYIEEEEGYRPDIVVILYPTSPLLESSVIDRTLEKMATGRFDSVIAVSEDLKHYWRETGDGFMEPFYPTGERVVRQLQVPLLKETGAVYVATRDVIMERNAFFGDRVGFVDMEEHRNVDIDTPFDFTIAEFIGRQARMAEKVEVRVGDRTIGKGAPVFIIAEAGVNHNGDFDTACAMVDTAQEAGADAVSFQHIVGERLNSTAVTSKLTIADWRRWELSWPQLKELAERALRKGLLFSVCVIDEESLDFVVSLGMSFVKVVSGDLTNIPFLRYCAGKGLPILLSTGGSTMTEIHEAIRAIEGAGNRQIVLYHTNSSYPTPPDEVNLAIMETLEAAFPYPVGFCDHSVQVMTSVVAAARGARVVEKHFSLDRSKRGPDFEVSLHPEELRRMIEEIRFAERVLGSPERVVLDCERETMKLVRRSVASAARIPKGTIITGDHLALRRPGTGIHPREMGSLTGKRARKDIEGNVPITRDMLEG
ncbi:MAG: N-acetylneuraminate synthase family protein [bacterium]